VSRRPFEERRTVSRKTPRDGKLELTAVAAARFEERERIALTMDDVTGDAALVALPCTCRGPEAHVHYFLESPLLRSLTPDAEVLVRIAPDGRSATVSIA
jgi:hypothetical protein